ncbi:hypothetical protein VSS74_01430 [Conexibacter stalactiti]|uniref:Secreted protein n=1 Tax=Conexibacter stalactiti TaxID=1940611 RepID=A0ABU4HJW1_9ACTN|nr:hypothetical protein [Conexibacter stalactiti]MDW5592979.1 hypothetical protein [Conexibacter stalactiti]MEC5033620.1 hypothetical protein [Conexibacter stalactiti]
MRRFQGTVAAIATLAAAGAVAGAAAGETPVPIGAPIDQPNRFATIERGTYKVIPLRVDDPAGGLPWGMATYLARDKYNPRTQLLCTEFGRLQAGQLGMLTTTGEFRPITPGGSPQVSCGGIAARFGERASGDVLAATPTILGSQCSPATASCDLRAAFRTIIGISLGRGILNASISDPPDGRWKPLQQANDGVFLAVRPGLFTDATTPSIRVQATTCGPDARPDLSARGTPSGRCATTIYIPGGPRPAAETRASRRARRARSLHAPIRIIQRPGTASNSRIAARVKLPITVTTATEGYAYRLHGPAGRDCASLRTEDTSIDAISSYLMVAGTTYSLPILPLNLKRGVWCEGRYRLTVLFTQRFKGRRLRIVTKPVASATFTIPPPR